MPERYRINPIWILPVAALAVGGATLVGYQLFEKQQLVDAIQSELNTTSARALELEQHAVRLSFHREEAVRRRFDAQDKLDDAQREIRELQSRLTQSTSIINELKNDAVKTRSEIEDRQFRIDALQSEVESLKQNLDAAYNQISHAAVERKTGF